MAKIRNYWKLNQQPQRVEKSGKKHGAREPRREGRFASRPEKMHPHHCMYVRHKTFEVLLVIQID